MGIAMGKDIPSVKDALSLDLIAPRAARPGQTALARLFDLCNTEQSDEYLPARRSLRIHGHSTTIRLEKAFWTVLEVIAKEEGIAVAELVTRIHDHCQTANQKNLASCLRVVCLKYINVCT